MNSTTLKPALDIFESNIEIFGVITDKSRNALPTQGSIFPEEMMIIWQCFHMANLPLFVGIGKLDSGYG